jgi:photosystem II stability/assembly factor-like uncharacterized protein
MDAGNIEYPVRDNFRLGRWKRYFAGLASVVLLLACGILWLDTQGIKILPPRQTFAISSPLCGTWHAEANTIGSISGLSAISSNNIWALGYASEKGQQPIYHWDGANWSTISIPNPQGSRSAYLEDIEAVANDSVWLVGYTIPQNYTPDTITEDAGPKDLSKKPWVLQWNGAEWLIQSIPNLENGYLKAVSAPSANDTWILGFVAKHRMTGGYNEEIYAPVAAHWDGHSWTDLTVPDLRDTSIFDEEPYDIEAVSPTDIWVLSSKAILHWDGKTWTTTFDEYTGPYSGSVIEDMVAISATEAWAVGTYYYEVTSEQSHYVGNDTLTMHWDGKFWNTVPSPNAHSQNGLHSVAAISSDDVWAVGDAGFDKNLVIHWDGKEWSIVPGPEPMSEQHLRLVAAAGPNQISTAGWARANEDSPQYPLIASFTRAACP